MSADPKSDMQKMEAIIEDAAADARQRLAMREIATAIEHVAGALDNVAAALRDGLKQIADALEIGEIPE